MTSNKMNTRTIDTSTISPGKGGDKLPVVPQGSKVTVETESGEKVMFTSGFSTEYQLCTAKGQGLDLHNFLTKHGAGRASPLSITVTVDSAE